MGRKPAKVVDPPTKRPLHLSIDGPTLARLSAYAAFRNESVSAVVVRAVEVEMRACGFVVYARSSGAVGVVEAGPPPALQIADAVGEAGAQPRPLKVG